MKTLLFSLFFAFIASVSFAQEMKEPRMDVPPVKKIEVTGFAETEIVPDIIYFSISLKEYFKDEKAQKEKVSIDILEKQLVEAAKKAGIAKEDLSIGNISGYHNWNGRKKPTTFLQSKQYILKLSKLNKVDGIIEAVEDRGVEYVNILRVDHSQLHQLKKDIKIKALQAAKEKAEYLLSAINEKISDVLEIKELDDQYYSPQPVMMYARANVMMDAAAGMPQESDIEYQKIKLSYRMSATFRIK